MKTKYILAGFALFGAINLSAYTYEVQPLIGKNFTENGAAVDDSTAYGLRINKYISPNSAIMFGYTRIDGADYNKNVIQKIVKSNRSCGANPCTQKLSTTDHCTVTDADDDNYNNCSSSKSVCGKCGLEENTDSAKNSAESSHSNNKDDKPTPSGANGNGNNTSTNSNAGVNNGANGNGNNTPTNPNTGVNNGANGNGNNTPTNPNAGVNNGANANGNGAKSQPHKPTKIVKPKNKLKPKIKDLGKSTKRASTDVDRFYINGLHNIDSGYSRLIPYVYAGFGYERVDKEYNDYKSQGFFDAGLGVKFGINDKVSLLADVQGIKKFRDNDFDILASLGLGFFFGANNQVAPKTTTINIVPKKKPVRKITIIKLKPKTETKTLVVKEAPKKVKSSKSGEYYIQLAAAFKTDVADGCHFTEEMDKEGISYSVKYTKIGGKNASVLVTGPYSSKEEAKEELAKIRKISKDAFIRRFKD